jgi:hypothetical protein
MIDFQGTGRSGPAGTGQQADEGYKEWANPGRRYHGDLIPTWATIRGYMDLLLWMPMAGGVLTMANAFTPFPP